MSLRPGLRLLNLGRLSPLHLHAAYTGLAEALRPDEAGGWLLLGRSEMGHVAVGASQYADAELDLAACRRSGVPVIQRRLGGGTVWVDGDQLCVFFIFPSEGGREAFFERCLGVLTGAFERLGLDVETVGARDIWSGGAKLLGSGAASIGAAQVFGASLLERFDANRFAHCVDCPSEDFREWLGDLLNSGMTDLARLGVASDESRLVSALSSACSECWNVEEAQPLDARTLACIAAAAEELAEPLDEGGRRLVRGGIKVNRRTYLLEDPAEPWVRLVWENGMLTRVASQDAEVERVLARCCSEPLGPGLVRQQALACGMPQDMASDLEARVLGLCRDAGR